MFISKKGKMGSWDLIYFKASSSILLATDKMTISKLLMEQASFFTSTKKQVFSDGHFQWQHTEICLIFLLNTF